MVGSLNSNISPLPVSQQPDAVAPKTKVNAAQPKASN